MAESQNLHTVSCFCFSGLRLISGLAAQFTVRLVELLLTQTPAGQGTRIY